jgi:ankyrin repeat protein/outer membrane lipoprotein-sorting protein
MMLLIGLAYSAVARADEKADALLSHVAAAYDALETLHAEIRIGPPGATSKPFITGYIELMKPDLARFDLTESYTDKPKKMLFVADGKTIWRWDPSSNEYSAYKEPPKSDHKIDLVIGGTSWLNLFYDPLYAIRYWGRTTRYLGTEEIEGMRCQVLEITAMSGAVSSMRRTVTRLYIDSDNLARKVVETISGASLFDGTTETIFRYTNYESVDPSEFVFQPPKGAKQEDDWTEEKARKADLKARDLNNGHTPLMEEADQGHLNAVRILLDRGAAINAKANDDDTALMMAVSNNRADVVKLLLDRGADMGDMDGHTLLLLAIYGSDYNKPNGDVVKLLLERGAHVNVTDEHGETPLLLAAKYGNAEIIESLIAHGADVNARDKDGWTPLMWVCHGDMARILLGHGGRVNVHDNIGQTPLIDAARFGASGVVRALLEYGADVNAREKDGTTALSYALHKHYLDIVEMLRTAGEKPAPEPKDCK